MRTASPARRNDPEVTGRPARTRWYSQPHSTLPCKRSGFVPSQARYRARKHSARLKTALETGLRADAAEESCALFPALTPASLSIDSPDAHVDIAPGVSEGKGNSATTRRHTRSPQTPDETAHPIKAA